MIFRWASATEPARLIRPRGPPRSPGGRARGGRRGCGHLLHRSGRDRRRRRRHRGAGRSIAVTTDQLCAIPDVFALAGGDGKATAIAAAIRAGLLHRLITDASTA
ncbi:sugar-binding domain-containing protein [Actinoplanes sp. NPDC026619]|uniref:sugar-binding domain-containing protein n=1 Tax=Actinoplanes sp. NPDC026619 TaxID=3155798 RepID=UPI0033C0E1DC